MVTTWKGDCLADDVRGWMSGGWVSSWEKVEYLCNIVQTLTCS